MEVFSTTQTTMHSGPLPAAEDLEAYERVMPGLAERIVRMAEAPMQMAQQQQVQRHQLENKVVASDIKVRWAGLVAATVIALVAIGGGIWLIANDHSGTGLASILAPLATLVGVFVYVDRNRRKERHEHLEDVLESQRDRPRRNR